MAKRKSVNTLGTAKLTQFRTLLDQFINKPANNPVTEHKNAGMDMTLMIHDQGFVAWHQHFVAELETWLVNNNGSQFVPCPYWDPVKSIPAQLNKGNNNVNMPLPKNLRPTALKKINSYDVINGRLVPYHNAVHNALGGQMPDEKTSPPTRSFGRSIRSWFPSTSVGGTARSGTRR